MKKAVIYSRSSKGDQGNCDYQREELIARFGQTHEIVGEYRGAGTSGAGLKKLLEDSGRGDFAVILCSDVARLTRRLTPEVVKTLQDNGVRIVTLRQVEVGGAEKLFAQAIRTQYAKTYQEWHSERTKRGIQAAKQRRKAAEKSDADCS